MKKTYLLEINKNPNIGLYICLNNKVCLVPKSLEESKVKKIEEITKTKIYKISVNNSDLIGVFLNLYDNTLLCPINIEDFEEKILKKICSENGIDLIFIDTKINALGNSICQMEDKIILSSNFSKKEILEIEKKVKKKSIILNSKNFTNFGGFLKYYNKSFFASQNISLDEFSKIKTKIKGFGTINKGSDFISSGVLINKESVIFGSESSPIEISNIDEWLNKK